MKTVTASQGVMCMTVTRLIEKDCILHYLDLPDQLIVLILVYIWKLVYFNLVLLNLFHNLKRESDQLPTDLHTQS